MGRQQYRNVPEWNPSTKFQLGGTVTYDAGTWWERANVWANTWSGGSWSQETNIELRLTPDANGWTLADHWQCARLQFGPINTPTFKSISLSFSWITGQNNDETPYLAWGSTSSLNDLSPVKHSNILTRLSSYAGGIGETSMDTVSANYNIYNYTVNGNTTWYRWFEIKLYCELPYDDTSNTVTVQIRKIALNKSVV